MDKSSMDEASMNESTRDLQRELDELLKLGQEGKLDFNTCVTEGRISKGTHRESSRER